MDRTTYDIIISEDAFSMLDRHAEFLARVSKSAALKTVERILGDIESLAALPERCPIYENQFIPQGRYRRLLSCKRYLIIFEFTADKVFVDYILDGRQENKELI